jgi:hypothetical protein
VSAAGKSVQNGVLPCWSFTDSPRMRPRPPPRSMPHQRSSAPPPNNSGADQLSRILMPSVPLRMMMTWMPQKIANAIAVLPGTVAQPAHAAANSASSANAPIQV